MSAPAIIKTRSERRDAFSERLLESVLGAFDVFSIYLGDQLGYYEVLAADGPLTSAQLAARTGTAERYAREWLEQQVVAGILEVEDESAPAASRTFGLPTGHDEVLVDRDSLHCLAPLAQGFAGAVRPLDQVLRAYREGGGVPFEQYGRDLREGGSRLNRPAFLRQLGQEWIPCMEDVHARLLADPPARVADFGCGTGWSSVGVARSYPKVRVDGFDLDAASVQAALGNAREFGVADRVQFRVRDAGDPELAGKYDLVMALECVHDMSDPVAALRTMRRLAGKDGAVLIVDERNAERFSAAADPIERLQYGFSLFHCLPAGMAQQPSAATGTVMRASTLRAYAEEAGFREVEVLPIENLMFRFYRLDG